MASCFFTSRFKYRLKSRPNPLQMYSATRNFPLRSRSRVRIRVGVSSRIIENQGGAHRETIILYMSAHVEVIALSQSGRI